MNRILIIGATGRLASIVVEQLTGNASVSLRLTSSRNDGVELLRENYPEAEVMKADWYDIESLKTAFNGVERVLMMLPDFVIKEEVVVPNIVAAYNSQQGIEQFVRLLAIPEGHTVEHMAQEYKDTLCGTALHVIGKSLLDKTELPLTYLNVPSWFTSNFLWFFGIDVKKYRKIRMPFDAKRPYLVDEDIASCFSKVLAEDVAAHLGNHYVIMGRDRYTFSDVAAIIGKEIGETVTYEDTDEGLKEMGEDTDLLITYLKHESRLWERASYRDDILQLLGHEPQSLSEWIHLNREEFI